MGRWIGIGLAIIGLIAIGFITAAAIFPGFREASRDIAIIILALFQLIGTLISIGLLLAMVYTVRALNRVSQATLIPRIDAIAAKVDALTDQARSVADNVKTTSTTVTTTTGYIAEQVVSPVIRATGLLAGVRAAFSYLARRDPR